METENTNEMPEMETLRVSELYRDTIKDFMKYGEEDDADEFLKEYFSALGDVRSLFFRQYIVTDMYVGATYYLETLGLNPAETEEAVGSMQQAADSLVDMDKTIEYSVNLIKNVIKARKERLNETDNGNTESGKRNLKFFSHILRK